MIRSSTFLAVVLSVGCGTDKFIPADAGATDGANEASSDAPSDAPGDANDPCVMMRLQIDQSKKMLQQCNLGSGGECMNVIDDPCCQFALTSDNTSSFQNLVQQYKNNCKFLCPGACMQPLKQCVPDGMGGGICK